MNAAVSLARILSRAPCSKASRARRRIGWGVEGCGVRAFSFRRVSLVLERRALASVYEGADLSLRTRSWRSRSDMLGGCEGDMGACWLWVVFDGDVDARLVMRQLGRRGRIEARFHHVMWRHVTSRNSRRLHTCLNDYDIVLGTLTTHQLFNSNA